MPTLTPGTYTVDVTGSWMTESSKGTLGLVFAFSCTEGEIECTRWVTPATSEYVLKDLETLGFSREGMEMETLDRIGEIIKGNRVNIVVEDEEYNGKMTAKVKWINAAGPRKAVLQPDSKKRLFAMLTGKAVGPLSAPRGASAPASAPAGQRQEMPPNTPIMDDDVPF